MPPEAIETEGQEADSLAFADFEDLFESLRTQESSDSAYMTEFRAFFETLGAQHFSADEMLFLGGGHYGTGSCAGLNGPPDKSAWAAFKLLVPALDAVRAELGHPMRLTSIYRNAAYNSCIGGVENSQHRKCMAADCVVSAVSNTALHEAAKRARESGAFTGGIGLYSTFVHIDVRGYYVDF